MSLVKVKIIYHYYATKRVTPIFMMEEDLMSLSYDEFRTRLITEVPHLEKMSSSLRLVIENLRSTTRPARRSGQNFRSRRSAK